MVTAYMSTEAIPRMRERELRESKKKKSPSFAKNFGTQLIANCMLCARQIADVRTRDLDI